MTTAAKRTRPRIGDIVRITTPAGAAVAQYTHQHPMFGSLLRVLGPLKPGASVSAPELCALAAGRAQFATFFPLGAACHRGIAAVVGAAAIPLESQPFPLFRCAMRGPSGAPTT